MQTFITGGTILTPDQVLMDHTLVIDGEKILSIVPHTLPTLIGNEIIDVKGFFVVPGFIDIHVHGAVGSDTMDATSDAILGMGNYFARHGVTSFLPTTVAAPAKDIQAAINNVSTTPRSFDGARHIGIHLEGPYLSYEFRGAQPSQHLRSANLNEYKSWFGNKVVRLITVAPEVEGVSDLIRAGTEAGIEFALGHTSATYEQVLAAVELGLHQATHTFNGMPGLKHRSPGVLGAVLSDDRIWAQIIVDGIHVHPAIVKLLVKAKGIDRTIIITDAIRASGMPVGDYALGDQMVHVKDGVARTDAGGLAGSTLTMDQALRNVMEFANINLAEALPMATRVPAAAIRLESHKGSIAPDFDADIVVLDESYHVRMTMVGGRVVYRNL
ncbi:MAG: N-acetylglucosamine-6-phosphate deacetylase [Planctomycetes bacterium]|nr:N-acetylglucosamine-6-phosphate deacetylase [Planctomycetota bacterium]